MAIGEIDIAAQVNAAVTRELARMTAELQASSYENIGQGGSRGHSVDWFDAADDSGSGMTTDYLFDGITKVTIPEKTTNFLKITKGNPATASWVAAMPDTQAEDSVVIDVTKNRIYIHGFFAG